MARSGHRFIAYSKLIESLGQQPVYLGWVLLNDRNYAFVFKGAKQDVLVTWAPRARKMTSISANPSKSSSRSPALRARRASTS